MKNFICKAVISSVSASIIFGIGASVSAVSGNKPINIYLAGDSTVKDYSKIGYWMDGKADSEGSWGEFLQYFFDKNKVKIFNYAQGGRSTRSFMNEPPRYDAIKKNIKDGDYLFIQFGHNDTSINLERGVFLGEPDENGIYPSIPGVKNKDGLYPNPVQDEDGKRNIEESGTYKWYLKQYVDMAKSSGAIPVIITPVSRLQFDNNGIIKPHHDENGTDEKDRKNGYVIAAKQVAEEQDVMLIDFFEISKSLYESLYKVDRGVSKNFSPLAKQLFNVADNTHHDKVGGYIMSELMVLELQKTGFEDIASGIKIPGGFTSVTDTGDIGLMVNGAGQPSPYMTNGAQGGYTKEINERMSNIIRDYMYQIEKNIKKS
ncbi:MAG: rhamnogalacturonan acetylesterase [Eubacterium sp.]|nr:rhamnogalacturonan acetylesterase [Eubacterium sp.]